MTRKWHKESFLSDANVLYLIFNNGVQGCIHWPKPIKINNMCILLSAKKKKKRKTCIKPSGSLQKSLQLSKF